MVPVMQLPVLPESDLLSLPILGRPDANILFLGSLGYPPNLEAVRTLLDQVLPRIRQVRPRARLLIAGSAPPLALQVIGKGQQHVEIITDFQRAVDVFREATVFVAPIPLQEGISVKTLNAFASGTPVVTTQAVLASLGAVSNVHALMAEDSANSAHAVLTLLDDPSLRVAVASAARSFVTEHFSEERLLSALRLAMEIA